MVGAKRDQRADRWTAAGTLEAETQFRKIIGYGDLAKLALAVEADLTIASGAAGQPAALSSTRRNVAFATFALRRHIGTHDLDHFVVLLLVQQR
jgi:hypothetical protein